MVASRLGMRREGARRAYEGRAHGGRAEGVLPSGAAPVGLVVSIRSMGLMGPGDGRGRPGTVGDEAFPRRCCNAPGLRLVRVRRVGLGGSARPAGSLVGDDAPPSQPQRCHIMAVITATMLH